MERKRKWEEKKERHDFENVTRAKTAKMEITKRMRFIKALKVSEKEIKRGRERKRKKDTILKPSLELKQRYQREWDSYKH